MRKRLAQVEGRDRELSVLLFSEVVLIIISQLEKLASHFHFNSVLLMK